ncbi:LysR family transcriptional regulator [Chitinimonas naiadis]
MELSDLRLFVITTRHASLQAAAEEACVTPSALSRVIRRLEEDLHTPLYDRVGKSLLLNAAGERLRLRALALLQLADETRSEFAGADAKLHCRVAAPPMLQWRYGPDLIARLGARHAESTVSFRALYEEEALQALQRGEVGFALVTGFVVHGMTGTPLARDIEAIPIGEITMQLAAGPGHPLLREARDGRVSTAQVLAQDFACPSHSLLCGINRGSRSDGWRDDQLPRRIRYWVDDLQVLLTLVRNGTALAYLPDFALQAPDLVRLQVTDCPYDCSESTFLLWRPSVASGWQRQLVAGLATSGC